MVFKNQIHLAEGVTKCSGLGNVDIIEMMRFLDNNTIILQRGFDDHEDVQNILMCKEKSLVQYERKKEKKKKAVCKFLRF